MLRESQTAIVARNETWAGPSATEPYEAGWASEAVVFMRALAAIAMPAGVEARIQISPDGIRWVDEGTRLVMPHEVDRVSFARVAHFGNWLRLATDIPAGATLKVLVTLHLK